MTCKLPTLLTALACILAACPVAMADEIQPPHLVVHSNVDCPGEAAVAAALWAIRPDSEWPTLTASISVEGGEAQLTLNADEAHRRQIPLPPDCSDRANRLALVIAVWSDALSAHAVDAPDPTVSVSAPVPAPAPALAPAKKSAIVTELGLLGFYSMLGASALGGMVEGSLFRRGGWWGIRASAGYQPAKAIRVDIGASNYDRTLLGASFVVRWERPKFFLASDGGLTAAFDRARGDGYSQNQSTSTGNVGLVGGGRAGTRLGRYRMWASVSLARWARQETIEVDPVVAGTPTLYTLPAWDAHAGLGLGLVFD